MDYQPGKIHESYIKELAFKLNQNFTIPICIERFHETDMVNDICSSIDLSAGSVIIVKWFKPPSKYGDNPLYAYIEGILGKININAESTVSKDFLEINSDTTYNKNKLFTDITVGYNRDKKINQLIKK
jgi:hypothetical protein